ncbi:hypothetical protein PVAP13_4NG131222 [Panicum virgatum]|uniref:Uncharacterized protein n=1 Tax=Panicum virgatum TaxID=38727 RepID=A0A8T0TBM3_PANVG|nr:hypothetical protein PVAP13_4NG131222 [Panicum virgatum]
MDPPDTRTYLLPVPTPAPDTPDAVPSHRSVPPGRARRHLHMVGSARVAPSRRPAPPGAPHRCPPGGLCRATPAGRRATFLPAGSYVDSAPSPLATGRRYALEHEPEPLSHETTALPGSAVN